VPQVIRHITPREARRLVAAHQQARCVAGRVLRRAKPPQSR